MINENNHPADKGTKRWRRILIGTVLGVAIILTLVFWTWWLRQVGDGHPPDRQVESDIKSFESALAMYDLSAGNYPTTEQGLQALREKPENGPVPQRWSQIMSRLPVDPWGNPYRYEFSDPAHPGKPRIFSSGADGVPGTSDDLTAEGE